MKSRIYTILLTAILVFGVYLSNISAAPIPYKKKIQVQAFQNPPGWIGTYNPGDLISDLLREKLLYQDNVALVSLNPEKLNGKKTSIKAIQASPAQVIISGKIVEYRPALPIDLESTKSEKRMSRSARIRVQVHIFQGQTKRLVSRFILNESSKDGEFPLGYSQSSLNIQSADFQKTYMGRALIKIADRMVPALVKYINRLPLDGQVIAVEKEKERMIINVGQKNGVEVRDEFVVYNVDVNYSDPLYGEDIGDRLTQLGVVRVINVQQGFSEAVIMAGGDFVKGNLVRSKKSKPFTKVHNKGKSFTSLSLLP